MVWNIHQRFKYDYLMLCWVSILNFRGVVVVFQCQCHSTPPSDWTPATSEVSGGFAWGGMQHLLGWSLRRSNFSKSINGCLVYTSQTTHLRNITLYKVKLPLCSNPFCKWFERGCWVTPSLTWYLGALGWITWPILFGYSWVVSCSKHIKDFQSLAEDSNLCNLPTLFSLAEAEKSSN